MRGLKSLVQVGVLALPLAVCAETLLRDAPLLADRFVDAALLVQLPRGSAVTVLKSEAGWTQVKTSTHTGWVRASIIDSAGATKAGVAQIESGRLAGNNIMSTSGIRGPNDPSAAQAEATKPGATTTMATPEVATK